MKRYETIVIIDPDVSDDDREKLVDKITNLIDKFEGFIAFKDEWGLRKLAYEIKKKLRGYYIRFDYCGPGKLVAELERNLRIDDRVIRFLTILLQDAADIEQVKKEVEDSLKTETSDSDSLDKPKENKDENTSDSDDEEDEDYDNDDEENEDEDE
ncbi:MAG: 30S ribosomal protein S6 [Desulfobacterales bacterium]|nr:30S ribosomal protein S6 [Desulfobacterales bacterium]